MRRTRTKRPTQRSVRNQLAWIGGAVKLEAPVKRGRQAESLTNDAIASWRHLHPGLVLERNKRRLATPPGMQKPIMLGWLAEGSPDWVGYLPVTVTASMIGRKVAVFVGIEAKRASGGVVSDEQEQFLNALKDAGGVAGVVRNAQDAEDVMGRHMNTLLGDSR